MKALRMIGVSIPIVLWLTVDLCLGQSVAEKSWAQGVEYAAQGKFIDAREEFEKALKVDPFHTSARLCLNVIEDVDKKRIESETAIHLFNAAAHGKKAQWQDAIAECSMAVELNPGYADAYIIRGLAHKHVGLYDKAIADFDKALGVEFRINGHIHNIKPVDCHGICFQIRPRRIIDYFRI